MKKTALSTEEQKGYPFLVIEVLPHSVRVSLGDAKGKRHPILFNRDFLREVDADVVGTSGTMFFTEKTKGFEVPVRIEIETHGKKSLPKKSKLRKTLKDFEDFFDQEHK
ncbi:MAG TPA: hypothetical protein P5096_02685 [Patescibacteria group bacterium]|nr:hypothetical protein [Patescibacteria group bacterium]